MWYTLLGKGSLNFEAKTKSYHSLYTDVLCKTVIVL